MLDHVSGLSANGDRLSQCGGGGDGGVGAEDNWPCWEGR